MSTLKEGENSMIEYVCHRCDDLSCETSVCPVCGSRTTLKSTNIYWSEKYNTPSFDEYDEDGKKLKYIAKDIRPVFAEERLLLEVIQGIPMQWVGKSVWNAGGSNYIVDGKKLALSYSKIAKDNEPSYLIEEIKRYQKDNQHIVDTFMQQSYIVNFIKINASRLNAITNEAIEYIKEKSEHWEEDSIFVSFSGGKDSTVSSHLTMTALGTEKVIHIYGDTTLEYPTTTEYVKRFRLKHTTTPMLVAKNKDQDFNNLCDVIGPPSRVLRWCCTIFKTGAITRKIETTFKNKKRILSVQGIRRIESLARSKYDRDSEESKIKKQSVISPIIDWMDFDVWLYILSNQIDFNEAYKQGFSRVGCWCCPNNSSWSGYLASIYMNEEHTKFNDILYGFAKKAGKVDWKEYVDEGKWKARQGGNGLEASNNAVVTFSPCALEENAFNFTLSRPISTKLYTLFIPFGKVDFSIGNERLGEVYVIDKSDGMPLLKLTGKIGKYELKVSVLKTTNVFKNKKVVESLIKDQITKYQTCIGCSACQSVCRFDACKVINLEKGNVSNETIHYEIDPNKCVGCLECVKHFTNGCYMKKVLRTKKG